MNPCSFFRANEAFLHRKSFPLKDQVPGAELQVLKQDWQDEQKVYDLRSSGGKKGEEGGLGLSGHERVEPQQSCSCHVRFTLQRARQAHPAGAGTSWPKTPAGPTGSPSAYLILRL